MMDMNDDVNQHLSRISTMWTMVFQAHKDAPQAAAARAVLLERYCGAIYRYLLSAVRDAHVADELAQEFALAFVQGNFKRADPDKGRFRDYVKTVIFNLIRKHHRRQNKEPHGLNLEVAEPAAPVESSEADEKFLQGWRDELLARTWEALAQVEKQTGQLFFTMLDYRTKHPDTSSAQMAEEMTRQLGKPFSAAGVRQTIHRGRDKFADLLIDEVGRSLETSDGERIEQELVDLGLLSYCQDAWKRRLGK
jgi:RNA polymerase sigma factor (sigma-70 family)